jgi:hypothetical protein
MRMRMRDARWCRAGDHAHAGSARGEHSCHESQLLEGAQARRAPHAAAGQLPEHGAHSDGRLRHALPQRRPQRGGVRDVDASLHKQRTLPRKQRRWRSVVPPLKISRSQALP